MGGRICSICDRADSIHGGRRKFVPRSSTFSSNVKPGGSVPISNSTPPGSPNKMEMKVGGVNDGGYVEGKIDEMLTPLELFGIVLCAKGNMMHRTRSDSADRRVGLTKQVNNSARCRVVRGGKAKPVPRFV